MSDSERSPATERAASRSERLTLLLVAAAFATIAVQIWLRVSAVPSAAVPGSTVTRQYIEHWPRLTQAGHRRGSPRPVVSVVLFSNLLCEYCALQHAELSRVLATYPDHIAVVHRHLPNDNPSYNLSLAMECAARQSENGGWRFADVAYSAGVKGERPGWSEMGDRLALDSAELDRCVRDPDVTAIVERDLSEARALHLAGTPSMIVNGYLYRGLTPADTIIGIVRQSLDALRATQ